MAPRDQSGPWQAVVLPVAPVEFPVAPEGVVPDDAGGVVVPELVWLLEPQPAVISSGTAASSGTKREYRRRAILMDDTIHPPSANHSARATRLSHYVTAPKICQPQ
jgi:hypothetical protein